MNGLKVGSTEEERYIGVTITSNLEPAAQCSKAAGRALSVLTQLRKNFHYRDRFTFVKLYKQYVRPHLEFAVPAWSPWLKGDKEILEGVQEKAVKMVSGLKGTTYVERCEELGLDTLEKRRQDQDMGLVYKIIASQPENELFKMANRDNAPRTRQATATRGLMGQFARTDPRKQSFTIRTVERWNGLPDNLRQAKNQETFKRDLKNLGRGEVREVKWR
jgi:hypothetical protein